MSGYYLGIDIGASSGRHMLGHLEGRKMVLEEIYRFPNGMKKVSGETKISMDASKNSILVWDTDRLFAEIINGMKKCRELGKIPESIGIDTWAVDFVLLDKEQKRIGEVAAYRDSRTQGMELEVSDVIPDKELYERTGIQKQIFNTIYQLMSLKKTGDILGQDILGKAETMLMVPDYFHYLLTGKMATEYTNATTTQLVNKDTKDWDWDLIEKLGYPKKIFQKIHMPGTVLGELREEIQKEVGFNCQVVLPATHDTASAVMAVPSTEPQPFYISSGTWSLLGTELMHPDCSEESRKHNFTNEGGYDYRYRYLKNIMGMWMIQSVHKEIGGNVSFGDMGVTAEKKKISSVIDCNDGRFMAPASMMEEVKKACMESGQQMPGDWGEVIAVIYHSLAKYYADSVRELEQLLGKKSETLYIVGGGSNAAYLNTLTAKRIGKKILAGPAEATAAGNIAAQMIAAKELGSLSDARKCILYSFPVAVYDGRVY